MESYDQEPYFEPLLPENRIKELGKKSNLFKVDSGTPAKRYFLSGVHLIRTADMHLKENQYEDAFIFYLRFITLFVEKMREHPDVKNVPPELVISTKEKLPIAMNKAEKIKMILLEKYKSEYEEYLLEKKKEEEMVAKKRKEELEKLEKQNSSKSIEADPSDGILKKTVSKDIVKPVPYLPDDFLVYEIPETKSISSLASITSTSAKPGIDRSTKPSYFSSISNDSSQFGSALRMIVVPSLMLDTFLNLAQRNTSNNVETCGILAGKLKQNRLIITHLLIPQQYGTSDSCTTHNEENLFTYQNEHDLITLGWIHTHPSQTAFLSSVDLHTHYSYQLMMAEAIAIVCAPRYSQTGFFQLTPDYGLDFIANCQQKGFHPHPSDPPLFQDAEHCEIDEKAPIELIDLRG